MQARYSGYVSQVQGTPAAKLLSWISSICLNMPARARWSCRFTGASDSEQLPISTVVTPCSMQGVARRSQQICGSKCVCTSMNPGASTLPRASMTRAPAAGRSRPTAAMAPSRTATSPCCDGPPVPSTMRALRIKSERAAAVSAMGSLLRTKRWNAPDQSWLRGLVQAGHLRPHALTARWAERRRTWRRDRGCARPTTGRRAPRRSTG